MRFDSLADGSPAPRPRRRLTRADVMTAREVAELLDLPVSTVYEFARRGILPCSRLGRAVRFVRDEIEHTLQAGGGTGQERGVTPGPARATARPSPPHRTRR
jgi:excisionase family DNA binding protein